MNSKIFMLFALFAVAAACKPSCRFKLCTPVTVKFTSPSDKAVTGPICLNGKKIGIANTGEARVETFQGPFNLISKLQPIGLTQKYSPSFLKTYTIFTPDGKPTPFSGIGHEVPQGNQAKFFAGRCAFLPIQEYQQLNNKYEVVKNFALRGKPDVDCVSFVIGAPF